MSSKKNLSVLASGALIITTAGFVSPPPRTSR